MNMYSLRKWMFKPKKSDTSCLAQFFYADEELNVVAAELDSFDGRKDPERCTVLVNKLRHCQDKVLVVVEKITQNAVPDKLATRDFRVKFPDDVLQDSLAGQLWFGAECLAAGSSIMNREVESASMRPLAKALTRQLDYLRGLLREQCFKNQNSFTDKIREELIVFDKLFAEFELSYVSAMVPVKTMKEYDMLQDVVVLFCETVERALKLGLLTQDMIDDYDPALMFTIPRLAIICGLLVYPESPINPDLDPMKISEMFRPFQTLLYKIRELLWTLSRNELWLLEKSLSSADDTSNISDQSLQQQLNKLNQDLSYPQSIPLNNQTIPPVNQPVNKSTNDHDEAVISHSLSTVTIVADAQIVRDHQDLNVNNAQAVESQNKMDSEKNIQESGTNDSQKLDLDKVLEQKDEDNMNSVNQNSENHGVPHQDSGDSGMLSMSDHMTTDHVTTTGHVTPPSVLGTEGVTRAARSLRKSQSWPLVVEGRFGGRVKRHSYSGSSREYLDSTELLECCLMDESVQHEAHTRSMGSEEFAIGIVSNRSSRDSSSTETEPKNMIDNSMIQDLSSNDAHTENSIQLRDQVSSGTESVGTDEQIIYTQNGFDTSSGSSNSTPTRTLSDRTKSTSSESEPQIAFVTGALNDFFFTDPSFQGVTPPRLKAKKDKSLKKSSRSRDSKSHAARHSKTPSNCDNQGASGPARSVDQCDRTEVQCSCDSSKKSNDKTRKSQYCSKCMPSVSPACSRSSKNAANSVTRNAKYAEIVSAGKNHQVLRSISSSSSTDCDWDGDSYSSSDTSSCTSEAQDDEEITLAIQAAEVAARREARARFKTSSELIQKLFICVSGVADQMQTNYASDLRHILKAVFECMSSSGEDELQDLLGKSKNSADITLESHEDSTVTRESVSSSNHDNPERERGGSSEDSTPVPSPVRERSEPRVTEEPPEWVPDEASPYCTSCKVPFSFVRRRHHCRNCGKIFCGRCSSNSVPLPHYGHTHPVRVCNRCFMFHVTPFTVDE